jgi:hypothetical protein
MAQTVAEREEFIAAQMRKVNARTTREIQVTKDLLQALAWAQARHTGNLLLSPYNRMGDDWGDDTNAALELMRILFEMVWDQEDLVTLDAWLNSPRVYGDLVRIPRAGQILDPLATSPNTVLPLGDIGGCDGYAPELYALDCIAMPKEN